MKTIIISDTHLTDIFDERKYNFLKKLIDTCDKLIVNGDFWSSYSCTFEEFTSSRWNQLFPLMFEKATIYLYGNHDPEDSTNSNRNLFSVEQGNFVNIKFKDKTVHIEHGHVVSKSGILKRLNKRFTLILHLDRLVRRPLESTLFHLVITFRLYEFLHFRNIKLKARMLKNKDAINIVGHTHIAENDIRNNFINSGFIDYGFAWYVEIDQKINLIFQKY